MILTTSFQKLSQQYTLIVFLIICFTGHSQSTDDELINAFEDYAAAPREVVYAHLNKSIYLKGEMMGFATYVFDKYTKKRSLQTTNLYCTISNPKGRVIKQKLIYVEDGVSSNVFNIDDSLSTGTYIFKAYTNWMLNFNEQNHFQQAFRVINAESNEKIRKKYNDDLDIQILGEGGHIIQGIINSVGIAVKNKSGRGLPNATGNITNDLGEVQTEFRLNAFGLAKAIIKPEKGRKYYANVKWNDSIQSAEISQIDSYGFNITLAEMNSSLGLSFKTNAQTFANIENSVYKIVVHNGEALTFIPLQFKSQDETRIILKENLFSGINIITVLSEKNKPILERLYFNNVDIKTPELDLIKSEALSDSIQLTFKMDPIVTDGFNSLSASILPLATASYEHHNSIKSQLFLQPYVKGYIENAGYYFRNPSRKKRFELDLLLLTQGWSSYNWTDIFNFEDNFRYPFERGIDVVATVNNNKDGGVYIVYPQAKSSSQLYTLAKGENVFTQKRAIPYEDDVFRVGQPKKDKNQKKPGIYPQFYPSKFNYFKTLRNYLEPNLDEFSSMVNSPITNNSWGDVEQLDEVYLEGKGNESRFEKLRNEAIHSRIRGITDRDKRYGTPLDQIINNIGFVARYDPINAQFTISNPRVSWGNPVPLVYIDGALIQDLNILRDLNTLYLDYIEYEVFGFGGGIRGQAGFIKIHTDYTFSGYNTDSNKTVSFDFPLTFEKDKTFYTPTYQFYDTDFFEKYGVITWLPNIKPDSNGEFTIKLFNPQVNTGIFLEGIINNNQLISIHEPIGL